MPGSIDEFLDFMPDSVTVFPWLGQTATGASQYSDDGIEYPYCRIEMRNFMVVDSHGRTIAARGRIIMGSVLPPSVKDRIRIPTIFTPRTPPIISVDILPDEAGRHHVTVYIG